MIKPRLGRLERRGKIQDRAAVLNRDNPSHRKGAAVAGAIDVIDDGRLDVPAAQEVGMQGMRPPVFYGVMSGGQRLAQHLPAKYLGTADIAALAAKNILFDTLEPQEM